MRLAIIAVAAALPLLAQSWKPKRINKAIELLESGQPIYYVVTSRGGYEQGLHMAGTWADYITYEMEHAPYDIGALNEFMRGLREGGPTRSGHTTPAVVVTLPMGGFDEATIRANYWIVQQVLDAGVHGLLLCHARTPAAVRAYVETARYPFHRAGITGEKLREGLRGAGGQRHAAAIWGVSTAEYLKKADVWPLNPEGELMLGLKIEDQVALANAEATVRVMGIAFAEWGPADMGMSFGFPEAHDPPWPPPMAQARARVLAACKGANIAFLDGVTADSVVELLREGLRIGAGDEAAAERGRRHTKREMPW